MRLLVPSCVAACLPVLALAQGYEIGPGDVVQVVVLGQQGLSGEFPVDAEGMMFFPFLGKVKASAMTAAELQRKLETLLADGYLREPSVSVSVKEYRSRKVFVTGEVQRPGAYGLRANGSLLLLITDVGGVTAEAGHEVVVVRPPVTMPASDGGGQAPSDVVPPGEAAPETEPPHERTEAPREGDEAKDETAAAVAEPAAPQFPGEVPGSAVFRVSLRELRSGNPDKDLTLEEGDTVYVPKAANIYVTGHVARPGAIRYEEGITVYQALTRAGGPTERGSSKVKILRLVDGKRQELRAEMADPLQPEDTIKVPERFF
jgi:polysaccharide biosynthesis/export protein